MAAVASGSEESATKAFAPAANAAALGVTAPPAVLSQVPIFLHRWQTIPAANIAAAITCRPNGMGMVVTAPVLPKGVCVAADAIEAADVVAASLAAIAVQGESVILPHAGAVESPAGLILLLADSTGGKSTLALTFAAAGWRLFGDDRLGLCRQHGQSVGIALGLAPKLRLPVPPSATGLADFAAARASRRETALTYLALGPEEQALAGTKATIAACLLLQRDGDGARLEPAAPPELVKMLAESAAAPWLSAGEVLGAAVSHAGLTCYRLHYAEAAEAVPVLLERFGSPTQASRK
jgi:hypothetical protein